MNEGDRDGEEPTVLIRPSLTKAQFLAEADGISLVALSTVDRQAAITRSRSLG